MMQTQTILVTKDQASLRQLIEDTFRGEPYHLVFATDGEETLRLIRTAQPELLLLDIVLPSRSGIDICRTLKADPGTKRTKVVFVSAHTNREHQAWEAGGDAFLAKPFSPLQMVETVSALLKPASKPDPGVSIRSRLASAIPA